MQREERKNKCCHYFALRAARKQSGGRDQDIVAICFELPSFVRYLPLTTEAWKQKAMKNEIVYAELW
jgi:hypothetical protein